MSANYNLVLYISPRVKKKLTSLARCHDQIRQYHLLIAVPKLPQVSKCSGKIKVLIGQGTIFESWKIDILKNSRKVEIIAQLI